MLEVLVSLLRFGALVLMYIFLGHLTVALYRDLRSSTGIGKNISLEKQRLARLVVQQSVHSQSIATGRTYFLGEVTSIGRTAGNDIVLPDPYVSSRHAVIKSTSHKTTIEDMGSVNGTYVNGTRITRPHFLKPGDRINIGGITFRYEK